MSSIQSVPTHPLAVKLSFAVGVLSVRSSPGFIGPRFGLRQGTELAEFRI